MDAYNAYLPALKKIAKALKGAGFKGRMIQTGKAKGKLNPTWLGTDKTPKADMVVGNNGISLKKRGGSQLTLPSKPKRCLPSTPPWASWIRRLPVKRLVLRKNYPT